MVMDDLTIRALRRSGMVGFIGCEVLFGISTALCNLSYLLASPQRSINNSSDNSENHRAPPLPRLRFRGFC